MDRKVKPSFVASYFSVISITWEGHTVVRQKPTVSGSRRTKCWSCKCQCIWDLCFVICIYIHRYTSSTAQGGGGSFKNGKPIGEASWCDAKMAERTHWWIERWLSVSPFLSLFLSFSLCLSFAIYLQSYLSSHLPIYLSIHVSIVRFVYSPNY